MIRNVLILTCGGAIGAVLSVWFLDDWVWGTVFGYAHGHGERLESLTIATVFGLLCYADVWRVLKR